jgi:CRISPR/Cas system CSM-associated protein Csm3 (group 7 of RAMP superfamily)
LKTWQVTIETLQPLSIASEPNRDSHWDTTYSIPGSTLRGAMAEVWKFTVGFDHPQTKGMFHEGIWRDAHSLDTEFNPLYVKKQKKKGTKTELLTGFVEKGEFPISRKNGMEIDALIEVSPFENDIYVDEAVGIKISPAREATSHGDLYTLSAVVQGTVFQTTAMLPQEGMEAIAEKVNGTYECMAVIGKKTSSGYGKVRINFKEMVKNKRFEELNERIRDYALNKNNNGRFYVSLVSKSPLLLRDHYGRYTDRISWENQILPMISDLTIQGEINRKLKPILFWGKSEQRHGWNSAWNMPKQADWVIQAGAVFVTEFEGLSEEERTALIHALIHMEQYGLGERTGEGFGEIEVCPSLEFKDSEPLPNVENQGHEDRDLLVTAKEFAHAIQGKIRIAQWHNLLTVPESEIVLQVLGEGDEYYLSKREKSRVRNKWKELISYNEKKALIAVHLREIVQEIYNQHQNYRIAGQKTKRLIEYVIGYVKISQKEEGE